MKTRDDLHEAALWHPEGEGASVRCGLCERRCLVPEGRRGFCAARLNRGGRLRTLAYGNLSAVESRPIEIKLFHHYWPGSTALTFSTWSCNLSCQWCQNAHLSRQPPGEEAGTLVPPQELVAAAKRAGDRGLCASFQEPTLLYEYCLELFPLARAVGLYCCWVSNGYLTSEALAELGKAGLDGLKIDIKGGPDIYKEHCGGADGAVPWRRAEEAKRLGLHVELVNLLVTDLNDDREVVGWLVEEHLRRLGPVVPLHFTRYHPAHRFDRPATPPIRLERAREAAFRAGVRFPYVGNLAGHRYENTFCPRCGRLLIMRHGPRVLEYLLPDDHRCPGCGEHIPVTGSGSATC